MSNNQEKLNEQLFNVIADEKASDEARLKKVKYLVRLGADVNAKLYGKSVLSKAIEQGAGAQVQNFLREKGANEWVISKEEALEVSQGFWNDEGDFKSLEEIKELLKKGADLEAKDKDGLTALMVAVYNGRLEVVKYLAECGADLEAKDKAGQTALIKAAINEQLDVVKCLMDNGADLDASDKHGKTALMKAASWGKLDVVKCLAEHGVDFDAKDKEGKTALMEAANWGKLDVVKYLAELGADLEAKDGDGETAFDIARMWGRVDCVEFLEEAQKKNLSQKTKGDKTGVSQIVKAKEGRD